MLTFVCCHNLSNCAQPNLLLEFFYFPLLFINECDFFQILIAKTSITRIYITVTCIIKNILPILYFFLGSKYPFPCQTIAKYERKNIYMLGGWVNRWVGTIEKRNMLIILSFFLKSSCFFLSEWYPDQLHWSSRMTMSWSNLVFGCTVFEKLYKNGCKDSWRDW